LQNTTFADYYLELTTRAKVGRVVTASPFSMGLLTNSPPPWHPAPEALKKIVSEVREMEEVRAWAGSLPNLALGSSFRREEGVMGAEAKNVPNVVGFGAPNEVHESVAVWREVSAIPSESIRRAEVEKLARKKFEDQGWLNVTWPCGWKEDRE